MRAYATVMHTLVCLRARRRQYFGTFFLRNRPELELMRRVAGQAPKCSPLRIVVLGCSIGAEVYSILWTIRSARPDLKVIVCAMDISREMLNFAAEGVYDPKTSQLVGAAIFSRLTQAERVEMFDWQGDRACVKPWLREGITWQLGDAADPELTSALGPQDIVVASNFLCHMEQEQADNCLRNFGGIVAPGGHLFISGVDVDVRTKVALDLGWKPLPDLLEEIHEGDPCVRDDWPWAWWGLEPLNKGRADWQIRYAAVFQSGREK
jgi:SAM-dependent methyltransferase